MKYKNLPPVGERIFQVELASVQDGDVAGSLLYDIVIRDERSAYDGIVLAKIHDGGGGYARPIAQQLNLMYGKKSKSLMKIKSEKALGWLVHSIHDGAIKIDTSAKANSLPTIDLQEILFDEYDLEGEMAQLKPVEIPPTADPMARPENLPVFDISKSYSKIRDPEKDERFWDWEFNDELTAVMKGLGGLAITQARISMDEFPAPNYSLVKVAEESGEFIQACVKYAEDRGEARKILGEAVDALSMILRVLFEGDKTVGLSFDANTALREINSKRFSYVGIHRHYRNAAKPKSEAVKKSTIVSAIASTYKNCEITHQHSDEHDTKIAIVEARAAIMILAGDLGVREAVNDLIKETET